MTLADRNRRLAREDAEAQETELIALVLMLLVAAVFFLAGYAYRGYREGYREKHKSSSSRPRHDHAMARSWREPG